MFPPPRRLVITLCMMSCYLLLWGLSISHVEAKPHPRLGPYAIADMKGALSWRDLSVGRRILRTLLDHAPQLPRFDSAAQHLQKVGWGEWYPWEGKSVGLDPKRGMTLFWDQAGAVRLLIHHRPGRARAALKEVDGLMNTGLGIGWQFMMDSADAHRDQSLDHPDRSPSEDGQILSGQKVTLKERKLRSRSTFLCRRHIRLLICDSQGIKPGPAPYWLTTDLDRGAVWLYVHTPEFPRVFGLPWESFEVTGDLSGDELALSIALGAGFNPLVHILRPRSGVSSVMTCLHDGSPVGAKVSLDPQVIVSARGLSAQLPWLKQAQYLLDKGWGGDALLTFDGGVDHPVLIMSLAPHPWSASQLSAALCQNFGGEMTRASSVQKKPIEWCILRGVTVMDGAVNEWRLPMFTQGQELIFGLFAPDVIRRDGRPFERSEASISFELDRSGVSGGFIDPAIFEAKSLSGGRISRWTLWAALSNLWNEGAEGLVDVPAPIPTGDLSLASALSRLARLEDPTLIALISPLTEESELFISLSDLASLVIQLTEQISWTVHSFTQLTTGNDGIAIEIRWGLL